ncbi:MAG: starch-binding protein [Ruminococcus sp.]|nr:starch-binding protein [Ruminococcus sp.]
MKRILSFVLTMLMLVGVLTIAPVSVGAAEAQEISVYFENNWLWSDVFVYTWGSSVVPDTQWEQGEVMLVGTSEMGNEVYKATIGSDATGVIFAGTKDDGSGSIDQTPDITEGFYDGVCYSMIWDNGNGVVARDIDLVCPDRNETPDPETPDPETPDPDTPSQPSESYTFYYVDYADNFTEVYAYAWRGDVTGDEPAEAAPLPGIKMEPTGEVLSENAEQAGGLVYSVTFDHRYSYIKFSGNFGVGEEIAAETQTLSFYDGIGKYLYWGNEYWYDSLKELEDDNSINGSPEDETEYITVYFQNNWLWTDVGIHYWGSATAEDTEYPGIEMDYYDNCDPYDVYCASVPADAQGIVISGIKDDGSGERDKTPDITEGFYDGICYNMTWDNGNSYNYMDITVLFPDMGGGEEEEITETSLEGLSVTLDGKIGFNLHYKISSDIMADPTAKLIVYRNSTPWYELPAAEYNYIDDVSGYYVYTVELAAREMSESIVSKVVSDSYNTFFNRNSLNGYCDIILSDPVKYAAEQNIVKAMLNYGAASQKYFDYGTDYLATDIYNMTEDDKVVHVYDFSDYAPVIEGEADIFEYYGASLVLENDTFLKFYFKVDETRLLEDQIPAININGLSGASLERNGNLWCISMPRLAAHELNTEYVLKTDSQTITYSAYSYICLAQQSSNPELVALANALGAYCVAAGIYNGQ